MDPCIKDRDFHVAASLGVRPSLIEPNQRQSVLFSVALVIGRQGLKLQTWISLDRCDLMIRIEANVKSFDFDSKLNSILTAGKDLKRLVTLTLYFFSNEARSVKGVADLKTTRRLFWFILAESWNPMTSAWDGVWNINNKKQMMMWRMRLSSIRMIMMSRILT